jgi:hypothetical protein
MGVAVAAERGPQHDRALGHRLALDRLEAAKVHGDLAGQGLADHPLGHLPDPGQGAEAATWRGRQSVQLARLDDVDGGRGPPEGPDLVGRLPAPLEQEGDAAQGGRGGERWRVGHGPSDLDNESSSNHQRSSFRVAETLPIR